nr:radical SAM family heme chaperone HemW [Rhodothalassium salexigens]
MAPPPDHRASARAPTPLAPLVPASGPGTGDGAGDGLRAGSGRGAASDTGPDYKGVGPDRDGAGRVPGNRGEPAPPGLAQAGSGGSAGDVFGLYIHWPYCARICPYCDFNVYKSRSPDPELWRRALQSSLKAHHARWPNLRLASIFFGGGTPSLMPPGLVRDVIDTATALWPAAPGRLEISLEANPGSAERARFADFAAAGVNRLSLGVQALDDAALALLGRDHSAAEALAALDTARACFAQVSADLIYARPDQTPAAWGAELDAMIALGVDHLSLYQLTIEPGTAFAAKAARGTIRPPGPDRAADLYALTQDRTAAAGLPAYEISNHARPAAESRHNRLYWQGDWYAGIGPGAHGRLPPLDAGPTAEPGSETGTATTSGATSGAALATLAHRRPQAWLDAALGQASQESGGRGAAGAPDATAPWRGATGLAEVEPLDARARGEEMVMLGLRLAEGLDLDALARRLGPAAERLLPGPTLDRAAAAGLVERHGRRLVIPAHRRALTDAIATRLLTD